MTTTKKTIIKKLSAAFSADVRSCLSEDELSEVRRRNKQYRDEGLHYCSTHEFYDSNMSMWDAFIAVFGRELDGGSETDVEITNAAWLTSKSNGFAADV